VVSDRLVTDKAQQLNGPDWVLIISTAICTAIGISLWLGARDRIVHRQTHFRRVVSIAAPIASACGPLATGSVPLPDGFGCRHTEMVLLLKLAHKGVVAQWRAPGLRPTPTGMSRPSCRSCRSTTIPWHRLVRGQEELFPRCQRRPHRAAADRYRRLHLVWRHRSPETLPIRRGGVDEESGGTDNDSLGGAPTVIRGGDFAQAEINDIDIT